MRALMKDLAILNDNRSMIIVIQFTADSPELAAKIANSLTDHYITSKAERRTTANREANAALTQRIIEMRGEVESLERRIQLTRQRYNLVQTRAGSVGQQQLEDLSAALTRATADRTQLEANYQRALALARSGGIAVDSSEVLGSNTISILREREATAERRLAELSTTLGPGHPTRLAAQAEVASAHGAIAAEAKRVVVALGAQVQAARQREASLKQQLADAEESASGLASVQADLTQLEKDADARRALYQMLMQRAEQTEQTDRNKPEQAGSRVVSLASPPVLPSSPHPKLAGAFGMLSGIAFGAFLSLVRGQGGSSFSRQEQVATETGLVTLTSVPKVALRGSSASLAIAVLGVPAGAEAGAIRLVHYDTTLHGVRCRS